MLPRDGFRKKAEPINSDPCLPKYTIQKREENLKKYIKDFFESDEVISESELEEYSDEEICPKGASDDESQTEIVENIFELCHQSEAANWEIPGENEIRGIFGRLLDKVTEINERKHCKALNKIKIQKVVDMELLVIQDILRKELKSELKELLHFLIDVEGSEVDKIIDDAMIAVCRTPTTELTKDVAVVLNRLVSLKRPVSKRIRRRVFQRALIKVRNTKKIIGKNIIWSALENFHSMLNKGKKTEDSVLSLKIKGILKLFETSKVEIPQNTEACETTEFNLQPFILKQVFGYDPRIDVKNLTRNDKYAVLAVSGNIIVIYDYQFKTQKTLHGHRNRIVSTGIDALGNWVVSTDVGPDSCVIIWNLTVNIPAHIIWEFNKTGCPFVKMSPCAKYLLTVVEKEDHTNIKMVSLWEWVYGRSIPDVSVEIDTSVYGCLKRIDFCYHNCHYLVLTAEKQVIFLTSIKVKDEWILSFYRPRCMDRLKDFGTFTDSTYVRNSHMVISGTSSGKLIVWSDMDWNFFDPEPVRPTSNHKNAYLQMLLDSYQIDLVYSVDKIIVTLNSKSQINFYDHKLQILHKIREIGCDPIVSLNFHLKQRPLKQKNKFEKQKESSTVPPSVEGNKSKLTTLSSMGDKPEIKHMLGEHFVKQFESIDPSIFDTKKNKGNQPHQNKAVIENGKISESKKKGSRISLHKTCSSDFSCSQNGHSSKSNKSATTCHMPSDDVKKWEEIHNEVNCINEGEQGFTIRDFITNNNCPLSLTCPQISLFLATDKGDVLYVNYSHNDCYEILSNRIYDATAMDANPTCPELCIGCKNGKLTLFNYEIDNFSMEKYLDIEQAELENVIGLSKEDDMLAGDTITQIVYLKYNNTGSLLAVGTQHGDVWIVDGANLDSLFRLIRTIFPIQKIIFSQDGRYLAYFDNVMGTVLYCMYDKPFFIGKIRAHHKPLTDIQFMKKGNLTYLYSISHDRFLVEFNISECEKIGFLKVNFVVKVEQFAIPMTIVRCTVDPESVIVICSSFLKARFIDIEKMEIIKTVQAPLLPEAIRNLQFCAVEYNEKFLFFHSKNEIGLIKCPFDGNPFRWISTSAASEKIIQSVVGYLDNVILTLGMDEGVRKYKVNLKPLQAFEKMGGHGAEPYVTLLEVEPTTCSLEDIEDLFFYSRLLHFREYDKKSVDVKCEVLACEVPDMFRALGYFMTEREEDILLNELMADKTLRLVETKVPFDLFIRLFVNHKHYRITEPMLKRSFEAVCKKFIRKSCCPCIAEPYIMLKDLAYYVENYGDTFSACHTYIYFRALMKPLSKDEEREIFGKNWYNMEQMLNVEKHEYNFIPEIISYSFFKEILLGLRKDYNEELNQTKDLFELINMKK